MKRTAFFICLLIVVAGMNSCKKKDRLSGNTIIFSIDPPAGTVMKGQAVTLTAQAKAPAGSIEVNPEWTVSSADATLNTTIGETVLLQGVNLGDVVVTATSGGMMTSANFAVVTFNAVPPTGDYYVYTDLGLPITNNVAADIDTNASANPPAGDFGLNELSVGFTPEGNNYQRASDAETGSFWGINLAARQAGLFVDLTNFGSGSIEFAIRLNRIMGAGERFDLELIDLDGTSVTISSDFLIGFSKTDLDWQEVSIPTSNFFTSPGFDEHQVRTVFQIRTVLTGTDITYDVDAVRFSS